MKSPQFAINFSVIRYNSFQFHIFSHYELALILTFICFNHSTDDALSYFDLWTAQFKSLKVYSWATLRNPPTWKDVEQVMLKLSEDKLYCGDENAGKLHSEFKFIKSYCTSVKLQQWNEEKVSTEKRWVEMFNHFEKNNNEYAETAKLMEYILCLPGTTASVERVFSSVNNVWTPEKTQLSIETLKSILMVKTNFDYSCLEFYEYIKTKPELLREIASKEKYTIKTTHGENIEIDDDSDNEKN